MRFVPTLVLLTALSTAAVAQTAASNAAHAASAPGAKASAPTAAQITSTMNSMQEMHDKMMAARTPAQRQALMPDHMKAMRAGVGMMGQMKGQPGATSMSPEMMGKRMDMMEMVMQMMLDREAARSASTKKRD